MEEYTDRKTVNYKGPWFLGTLELIERDGKRILVDRSIRENEALDPGQEEGEVAA